MIKTTILDTPEAMGKAAAETAIEQIARAIDQTGQASIILATGASQFEVLGHLVKTDRIDWSRVTMFHLDEYVGMPDTHKASFRKYLKARFISQVSPLKAVHLIDGDAQDPNDECRRLSDLISRHEIVVTLAGIGENGHLAFNDPPADFETPEPYLVVDLDTRCRQQQLGEGWFSTLDDVPEALQGRAEIVNGSLPTVLETLHNRGLKRLYIDGGKTVQSFLAQDLIDELIITRIPILLGGGTSLFGSLKAPLELEHIKTEVLATAMVQSHYRRKR